MDKQDFRDDEGECTAMLIVTQYKCKDYKGCPFDTSCIYGACSDFEGSTTCTRPEEEEE